MIPREIIDQIVDRTDIEQLIGGYVTLKKAGSNYSGLCPFHSEKTPSFTVFTGSNSFYCFGCGVGGDAITFLMRMEGLDYVGAIEALAERAGVSLPKDGVRNVDTTPTVSRKRIYEMNLEAAKFFRSCLWDPKIGAEPLRYFLEERRLSPATVKHFGLGYSPNDFGMLTTHLKKLGYTDEELKIGFLAGISEKTKRPYDYFRNRVMFPIIDTQGNIVAFGGRVMDDSKPKYLNTSDTPAFKKSHHLFALNYAKDHASERMLLCEGYMDVIACHAAGFENAVATLGTAITPDQARIFARYTKEVAVLYDADAAGKNADDKAIRLLREVGVKVTIVKMQGAKDPDEYIRKYGAESFRKILGEGKSGFEYQLDKACEGVNLELTEERIRLSNLMIDRIAAMNGKVEREISSSILAKRLNLSLDSIGYEVDRIRRKKQREAEDKLGRDAQVSLKNLQDRVNPDAARFIRANAQEEAILGMLTLYPEWRRLVVKEEGTLAEDDFVTEFGRRIFSHTMELERSEGGYSNATLEQFFNVEEYARILSMQRARKQLSRNDREVFLECINELRAEKQKKETPSSLTDMLEAMRAVSKQKDKSQGDK